MLQEAKNKKQKNTNSENNNSIPITRPDLKIAAILDEFSYICFQYECQLIPIGLHDWKNVLLQKSPDLLLVESAWEGNNKAWQYKIASYGNPSLSIELSKLVKWCKMHNIPTAFWNKEDPIFFKRFINAARLFDYIFTTDINTIQKYKKIVGHDRVYVLPFAAQPKIHNPIDRNKERLGRVAFAGTYHRNRFPNRKKDIEIVLEPALQYDLHIYDRQYKRTRSRHFQYPSVYKFHIKENLPYQQMVKNYKKYDVFLNVNIVQNSPTMFSRRVFELLACGTNVISAYSLGIEKMFDGIVMLCKKQQDTIKYLDLLLNNKDLRDKLSLLGQREIFNKHTYRHRIETILEKIQPTYRKLENANVSIIACMDGTKPVDNILRNYQRQNYHGKELILLLRGNYINLDKLKEKIKQYDNVRIFLLNKEASLGKCLNFGIAHARFNYISVFHPDHFYSAEFIRDLMNTFQYTNADIAGKRAYYIYSPQNKVLGVLSPRLENCYVKSLSESAFIMRKNIFNYVQFRDITKKAVHCLYGDCIKNGIQLFAADRFNYVCIDHSFYINSNNAAKNSNNIGEFKFIGYTDDYISHITV